MHDVSAWSFSLGRLAGINIRVHYLFPFVALGWILHVAYYNPIPDTKIPEGIWLDATIVMFILFVSVLLHELGHCFAARSVEGDATEVLLWPLGGLAGVELPPHPRAHFLTAAAGPAVNVVLAVAFGLLLLVAGDRSIQPNWNPIASGFGYRNLEGVVILTTWSGAEVEYSPYALPVWLARACWINYFLALVNIVLCGFPLDGGRMLQAALWPSLGYRQATLTAVYAGFAVVFVVGLYAIVYYSVLALCLALFIFSACRQQWVLLEMGGEEGALGYDFSQGYTSLEREPVQSPPQKRISWWRRWLQRRAARRIQKEQEQREADERRMDQLLEKLHREGRGSLTAEEERFMKRVADRYRNKP